MSLFGRATPAQRKRIADVESGTLVRIEARVAPGPILTSPLERVPCVAYRAEVEGTTEARHEQWWMIMLRLLLEGTRFAPAGESWAPVASGESSSDFFIEDATGRARVLGAKIQIQTAHRIGWQRSAPPSVRRFVVEHGQFVDQALRWREMVVRAEECVVVTGVARWYVPPIEDGQHDYRGRTTRALVIDAPELGWITIEAPLPRR